MTGSDVSDAADGSRPADRLRERAGGGRVKLWLLLGARRSLVAGLVLVAVFGGLLAIGLVIPAAETALTRGDAVETLFQALATATVTGVTLVVTLNQLVLSQELGAVGDQRDRMEGATAFREAVADAVGAPVAPAEPATLLRALIDVAEERGDALEAAVEDADTAARRRVAELAESLRGNADRVRDGLEGARFGRFEVVSAALDFNYSRKLHLARRLRAENAGALDAAAIDALEDVIELLELFGPAREHVKTLYFQWALIDLSKAVVVTAIPALIVSAGVILFLDPRTLPPGTAGVAVVAVLVAVALAPFAVLLAYVLRIATVAKRTLAIGALILRPTGPREEVPWREGD